MTASQAATLARVQRCGRAVADWDALGVYLLARELGVTLTPMPTGELCVMGDRTAALFLAPALKRHKSALLRGACARCNGVLATNDAGLCEVCEQLSGRVYVYEPGGVAERCYLEARAAQGIV